MVVTTPAGLQKVLGGIQWVIEQHQQFPGPAVVCLAVSGPKNGLLDNAIRDLIRAGITVVVPAGDFAGEGSLIDKTTKASETSPGGVEEAITVGALTPEDLIAPFSKRGGGVDIWAPGAQRPLTVSKAISPVL